MSFATFIMEHKHVCIIGGGIIGIACAYYLLQLGYRITLVEKNRLGQEASHGNCGIISPGHLLPLTQPGVVKNVLKLMYQYGRLAPIYIKPRFSIALWSWLWQFSQHCNLAAMLEIAKARVPLAQSTYALYNALFTSGDIAYKWHENGSLHVYQNAEVFDHVSQHEYHLLKEHFGTAVYEIAARDLPDFESSLKPTLAGGWLYPGDAHLQPDLLFSAWVDYIRKQGVEIKENCEALQLIKHNGQANSLITSIGNIDADYFVFATGAFTPFIQKELGCKIPIQPGKGYSISLHYGQTTFKHSIFFCERSVVLTPMDEYYRLGSTMEFCGYDKSLPADRLNALKTGAQEYLQTPLNEPIVKEWCGLRPMTPDDLPYIGPCPSINNVFIAVGHNMWGVTMAPVTGKLIAELVSGVKPHIDLTPYRLNR